MIYPFFFLVGNLYLLVLVPVMIREGREKRERLPLNLFIYLFSRSLMTIFQCYYVGWVYDFLYVVVVVVVVIRYVEVVAVVLRVIGDVVEQWWW